MQNREVCLKHLYEINQKIYRIQNFDRSRINEGKLSILTEAVDEKDMEKLRSTVATFRIAATEASKQIKALLSGAVTETDEAKEAADKLTKYLTDANKSLVSLEKSTVNIDFESGRIKTAIAGNITVPALVAVTTQQIGYLESFLKSFEAYKKKVVVALVPLSQDDEQSLLQQKEVEPKLPDKEKMIDYASEIFGKEKKVGFFSKVKTFFKSIFSGEARGIASKFPKYDADDLGEALAILMINVKVGVLKKIKPAKIPSTKDTTDAAEAAQEDAGEGGGRGDSGEEADESGLTPSQIAYLRKIKGDKSSREFGDILRDKDIVESVSKNSNVLKESAVISRWKVLAGIKEEI